MATRTKQPARKKAVGRSVIQQTCIRYLNTHIGLVFTLDDLMDTMPDDTVRGSVSGALLALGKNGFEIHRPTSQSYLFTGKVTGDHGNPVPAVQTPLVFEYVGQAGNGVFLLRDEVGLLYRASRIEKL